MTPFCANWAQKTIFKRFYQLFFGTTGLQHKLLILIESSNIFHWKLVNKSGCGQNLDETSCEKTNKIWYFKGIFLYFA